MLWERTGSPRSGSGWEVLRKDQSDPRKSSRTFSNSQPYGFNSGTMTAECRMGTFYRTRVVLVIKGSCPRFKNPQKECRYRVVTSLDPFHVSVTSPFPNNRLTDIHPHHVWGRSLVYLNLSLEQETGRDVGDGTPGYFDVARTGVLTK